MNTPQQIQLRKQEKFIGLRAEGFSYMAISKKLKISRETCSKWEKELGERLSQEKRDRIESVYNQYGMMKEARIKGLGDLLKKVEGELSNRSLEDVSSDKLIDLSLKIREALKEEYSPVNMGAQESLTESIRETVEILTTRIKSGELETNSLKSETASLLSLVKAKESLPSEDREEQVQIRFHVFDDVDKRLDEIKAQAEIMTTPEKDSVLSMIQELKAMKDCIDDHNPEKEILTVSLPRGGAKK